jgi:hypothetical protein
MDPMCQRKISCLKTELPEHDRKAEKISAIMDALREVGPVPLSYRAMCRMWVKSSPQSRPKLSSSLSDDGWSGVLWTVLITPQS